MRFLAFQYQTACLLEDLVLLLHYRSSLILTPAILFREGFFCCFFYFLNVRKKCSFSEICSPRARMAQCQTSSLVTVCVGIIASFSNSALPPVRNNNKKNPFKQLIILRS